MWFGRVSAGVLVLCSIALAYLPVYADSKKESLDRISSQVQMLVDSGKVVGAQLAIGRHDQLFLTRSFGVRSNVDETPVDSETLFCIGSCSKPIASAVVMTLVDDRILSLNKNIEAWLPSFGSLETAAEDSVRSPTLAELLSHHGGIYSQKTGMTLQQARWIRDFKLSLEMAVDGISEEPCLRSTFKAEFAWQFFILYPIPVIRAMLLVN